MTSAVGTSLLVITLQAGSGLLGHPHHARVDWPLTLAITALAIAGSLLGARLADRIPAQLLRTGFGWFLTAMATLVLVEQAPETVRHALTGTTAGRIALLAGSAALVTAAARHVQACRAGNSTLRLSRPTAR
jgi:uncharacterized membrane protein YfcA